MSVAAVVWLVDVLTKQWALANLGHGEIVHVVRDLLRLELTANSGAAFSMGTGVTWLFTGLAAAVSVFIALRSGRVTATIWRVGLGGLLGGALGNLTDRLTRPPSFGLGHVVDFIALPNFPVFNVADSAIVCSVALMFIASWRGVAMSEDRETAHLDRPTNG